MAWNEANSTYVARGVTPFSSRASIEYLMGTRAKYNVTTPLIAMTTNENLSPSTTPSVVTAIAPNVNRTCPPWKNAALSTNRRSPTAIHSFR
jgi:hypothetical protein